MNENLIRSELIGRTRVSLLFPVYKSRLHYPQIKNEIYICQLQNKKQVLCNSKAGN